MAPKQNFLFWVFFFSMDPFPSQSQELFFNGFQHSSNNISLNGAAEIQSNGILRLTNATSPLIGHAFYPFPIRLKNSSTGKALSFSTNFAFCTVPEFQEFRGDGFSFTMTPSKELPGAIAGQFLGLFNASDNGTNHVFTVEFNALESDDFNDNRVEVDLLSLVSNASVTAAYFIDVNSTANILNHQSGRTILAWIDYDSADSQLIVTLSLSSTKSNRIVLSFGVDLSPYLDEFMHVGFAASTGLLASSHYLMGWSFKVGDGEVRSLDLSSLPSLPVPRKTNTPLILGLSISAFFVSIFAVLTAAYVFWKWKNRVVIEPWDCEIGTHRFPYEELTKATKGFSSKELLGFGGFGRVYKGVLPKSNTQIAIKRISHESKQGFQEFFSEIATVGRVRHRNLVQLLGWCRRRGDLLLVYNLMPNGSLDKLLFDEPKIILSWDQRFKIIKGVASGLLYLHEECEQTVIHGDIKAGNVLLDADLNGRLGDFGLAKLYEHGANPSTTRVMGTMGYLAPELTRVGKPTTCSDVFAFGALLLEVACGRRPIDRKTMPDELILVDFVWDRWREGAILEVMDPKLKGQYNEMEAMVVLKLGLMCSADAPLARPTMRQVARYLQGEMSLPGEYAGKKGGSGSGDGGGLEDYVHSYRSSYFEKTSTVSAAVNIEATSSLPLSTSVECR